MAVIGIRDIGVNTQTGDLSLVSGDLVLVGGIDSIAQAVKNNLQLIKGEWFLDTSVGVDYYGKFFLKNPSLAAIRTEINSAILGTLGIVSVDSLDLAYNGSTRTLTVNYTATTDAGLLVQTVQVSQ